MKVCNVCKVEKPLTEYHKRSRTCKPCAIERSRRWRLNNPERFKATIRRAAFKRRYGITEEDRNAMLENQGFRCAICRTEEDPKYPLNVDHCHTTGRVRGLLCKYCNLSLGWHEKYAEKAAEYLKEPS